MEVIIVLFQDQDAAPGMGLVNMKKGNTMLELLDPCDMLSIIDQAAKGTSCLRILDQSFISQGTGFQHDSTPH
jgi:hypothetical protein